MIKNKKKTLIIHNNISGEIVDNFWNIYPQKEYFESETLEELNPDRKINQVIKSKILLSKSRGRVFRPCPGTSKEYLCCNYWVLNQSLNCPFNCSYCILQYYLNNPYITVFTDTKEMIKQIEEAMNRAPNRFFRIGTGELADSLALNEEGHFSEPLIHFAAKTPGMLLELKTKSDRIDSLLKLEHKGKTVLAWSINPPVIISKEEYGTASLHQRLQAVDKAVRAGYKLAFHFDPIVDYRDWEKDYDKTIMKLFEVADPALIAWISIGSLRFPADMKEKIMNRFPNTILTASEMIRGMDGKMRYFKPLRISLYKSIISSIHKYGGSDLFLYFCMEDHDVWQQVLGKAPESNEELDYWFARHLYQHFPGLIKQKPKIETYLNSVTPRHRDQF